MSLAVFGVTLSSQRKDVLELATEPFGIMGSRAVAERAEPLLPRPRFSVIDKLFPKRRMAAKSLDPRAETDFRAELGWHGWCTAITIGYRRHAVPSDGPTRLHSYQAAVREPRWKTADFDRWPTNNFQTLGDAGIDRYFEVGTINRRC